MDKIKRKALTREFAKGIKIEADLSQITRILAKLTFKTT